MYLDLSAPFGGAPASIVTWGRRACHKGTNKYITLVDITPQASNSPCLLCFKKASISNGATEMKHFWLEIWGTGRGPGLKLYVKGGQLKS